MRIIVVGAQGFVGSAFVRQFAARGHEVVEVTRSNYDACIGLRSDIVVEAACNSRKFWAEEHPLDEFDSSVAHRIRTLRDFPTELHVHLSSVDVYDDLSSPASTHEDTDSVGRASNYGFHKLLAEQIVQRYASRWLILRLAGMLGPGLKKNPVYDILHNAPLRIHPASQYQFMETDAVASIATLLIEGNVVGQIVNVCGSGLISPREIAAMVGLPLNTDQIPPDAAPRIVDISLKKIGKFAQMPATQESVRRFVDQYRAEP